MTRQVMTTKEERRAFSPGPESGLAGKSARRRATLLQTARADSLSAPRYGHFSAGGRHFSRQMADIFPVSWQPNLLVPFLGEAGESAVVAYMKVDHRRAAVQMH